MSSNPNTRDVAMLYMFGCVYGRVFNPDTELNDLLLLAVENNINYEDRLSLLTWLKDEGKVPAYRYVSSVKDVDWKIIIENFKRKTIQEGTNPENTLSTQDKPPMYDDTQSGDAYTPDSGGAQMAPRDPTFRTLTKQYLKGSGK